MAIKRIEGLRDTADFVEPIVFDGRVYFTTAELGCRCHVCKGKGKLAPGFREALLGLRLAWARPMPLSSVCRCLAHNKAVGGMPGSYHIYETEVGTCAFDNRIVDSAERADFVELCLQLGWRVGVNKNFVHADRAPDYYENEKRILFLY